MRRLFRQFSFPGGIPSHVAPETPGSIHEGGELGYALAHAYGAAFDNPDLLVGCVVGDGEAETGPLAASWHSNKFLNPARDGAVLPILHLNGYKIANPTVLSRIPHDELDALMTGYGHRAVVRRGRRAGGDAPGDGRRARRDRRRDPAIQDDARAAAGERPRWPMIVLRTPKGWTGPQVDGAGRGHVASHQVPLTELAENPEHVARARGLDALLPARRSCSTSDGRPRPDVARARARRASAGWAPTRTPTAACCCATCACRTSATTPSTCRRRRRASSEATRVMGDWLRDVAREQPGDASASSGPTRPPPTGSARSSRRPTARGWPRSQPADDHVSPDGRVMEVLSEHLCQGWLEGYLLTGRHGLFNSYEAFIHIVDSMFNQHAKWLKVTRHIPWRRPIASLNYLLSSHVWRQDHNGFSHQDPGFIDHVVNKKAEIIRVYLPPDANCLLSVADHCLRSRHYVNVIVAGKQPALDYLTMDEAIAHCTRGIGIWDWASSDDGGEPDVVLGCAGDIPTLETSPPRRCCASTCPELKVRVVNVVDLMRLQDESEHPHGLSQRALRRALHRRQAGDLRLPRLPVADPPPHLPAHQPPQPARARLQGGGHHHDAVRHGDAQRHGPLPPGDRRHRPRARARPARRAAAPGDGRRAPARPRLHARARRRPAGAARLGLAGR